MADELVAQFGINLSFPGEEPITATWSTRDGSALAGVDYTATNGVVTFAPGELTKVVEVPLLEGADLERKFFSVVITGMTGATIEPGAAAAQAVLVPETEVRGDPGADGRTVLSGAVNPSNTVGADGDFYLNTTTSTMFGPKAGGAWPAGVSLKGAKGDDGTPGSKWYSAAGAPAGGTGVAGDYYLNTTTGDVYGPKAEAWGGIVANLKGPEGGGGGGGSALIAVTTADQANQATTIAPIATVAVEEGQAYYLRFAAFVRPSDNTKGLKFGIVGSAGPQSIQLRVRYPETAGGMTDKPIHDKADVVTFATSEAGNAGNLVRIEGIVHIIAAGTLGVGYAVATEFDYQQIVRGAALILEPLGDVPLT